MLDSTTDLGYSFILALLSLSCCNLLHTSPKLPTAAFQTVLELPGCHGDLPPTRRYQNRIVHIAHLSSTTLYRGSTRNDFSSPHKPRSRRLWLRLAAPSVPFCGKSAPRLSDTKCTIITALTPRSPEGLAYRSLLEYETGRQIRSCTQQGSHVVPRLKPMLQNRS